jgi:NAD(P)-dependent dehydrogenase (short-subunit alcohol dehydrogenase family)
MLHITNGDSAVERLNAAGMEGGLLPWRDVLHEGPVPAGLDLAGLREIRAGFIASHGWAPFENVWLDMKERDEALEKFREQDELVLWFEHDLYDQLQLLQILDYLASKDRSGERISLICNAEYLGTIKPERLRELFQSRPEVTLEQYQLGNRAWAAFRSPDPHDVERVIQSNTSALPFLQAALVRHLEQFPSVQNGLSRSEQQALSMIASGKNTVGDIYVGSHHEQEEAIFLGDIIFAMYLAGLSRGPQPLVLFEGGDRFEAPKAEDREFWKKRVMLTNTGRKALQNEVDWIALNGIDRWYGGVHLYGEDARYRWDTQQRQIIETPPPVQH